MDVKPNFTVENEAAISAPPKVDFGKTPPAAPAVPAPATPPAKTSDAASDAQGGGARGGCRAGTA